MALTNGQPMITLRRELLRLAATIGGSVSVMLLMLLTWQAMADRNPRTDDVPRLIPYNGVMEFNGRPVTLTGADSPWIQFDIYDAADNAPLYQQRMQVEVRQVASRR